MGWIKDNKKEWRDNRENDICGARDGDSATCSREKGHPDLHAGTDSRWDNRHTWSR